MHRLRESRTKHLEFLARELGFPVELFLIAHVISHRYEKKHTPNFTYDQQSVTFLYSRRAWRANGVVSGVDIQSLCATVNVGAQHVVAP